MTIKVSSNKDHVDFIRQKLKENQNEYGFPYCPCAIFHNDDTICMCKEFREMEEGECHCGLYVKIKD